MIAASLIAPRLPYEILKYYMKNKKFNKNRFNRDLWRLRKRGDITMKKDSVKITQKGKDRIINYQLEELKIRKPKRWDKKWRLVIFDIPESRKDIRDLLSRKLKDLGFLRYQKSVFICPYPCQNEINYINGLLMTSPYVKLLTAIKIDDAGHFMKKFNLE